MNNSELHLAQRLRADNSSFYQFFFFIICILCPVPVPKIREILRKGSNRPDRSYLTLKANKRNVSPFRIHGETVQIEPYLNKQIRKKIQMHMRTVSKKYPYTMYLSNWSRVFMNLFITRCIILT